MCRGHYSPKLSRPLVSKLYQAAKEKNVPMTVLADEIMSAGLAMKQSEPVAAVHEQPSQYPQPQSP